VSLAVIGCWTLVAGGGCFNDRLVVDAFVVGTAFGEVGTTLHGGLGLRYAF
jgi:hypothetical protein